MQVRIMRRECCGNAECVAIASGVFAIDGHQKAVVIDPDSVTVEVLLEAAEACPCQAIRIDDDDGTQVFP